MTDFQLNRYRGGHLAQWLWEITHGQVKVIDLNAGQDVLGLKQPAHKMVGAHQTPRPVQLGYELYIDYHEPSGYQGERIGLTLDQFSDMESLFSVAGLATEFYSYMDSFPCPSNCWSYHSGIDRMRLTPYGGDNLMYARLTEEFVAVVRWFGIPVSDTVQNTLTSLVV